MVCDKCGKEIPNDFMFCPFCKKSAPEQQKTEGKKGLELPPVPPSFSRPIPTANLPHSKRQKKLYGYGVTQKSKGSKGTGCLVLALIFLFLSIAFVSGLFITDKLREKNAAERTSVTESTTVPLTENESSTAPSSTSAEATTKKPTEKKKNKKKPTISPSKKESEKSAQKEKKN